jgi:hypothetical protein
MSGRPPLIAERGEVCEQLLAENRRFTAGGEKLLPYIFRPLLLEPL